MTVDELAERTGMTVRNIREYQRLGLLAPPERHGRVGYYDESHVERLARVRRLHDQGYPLELVGRILDTASAPFSDEAPEPITRAAFLERFNVTDDAVVARAVASGLLREGADGALEMVSPRLAGVGDAMVQIGLTLDDMLTLLAEVRVHQDAVADVFLGVFKEHVWDPFEAAGAPAEGLPLVTELLALVRPRALDTVHVAFQMAMDAKAAQILGVGRLAADEHGPAHPPSS